MRIDLPYTAQTAIIKRVREAVRNEKRLTPDFPKTTTIHLSNPTGVVTFTGKGCYSVAAQRLFRVVNNLLSQQS